MSIQIVIALCQCLLSNPSAAEIVIYTGPGFNHVLDQKIYHQI